MTKEEIEEMVAKTVIATLKGIGVHVGTDEEIEKFRKDMEYTRAWRETIQKSTRTGWLTAITVITTGFLGILYIAIRIFFLGHP